MIGDWVDVYHELPDESGFYKPLQVTGIHSNDGVCFGYSVIECPWDDPEEFEEAIMPIPLTPEILEKNGFELQSFSGEMYGNWWESPEFLIREDMRDSIGKNNFKFEYVHQLQHALKLCGVEKEIILQ